MAQIIVSAIISTAISLIIINYEYIVNFVNDIGDLITDIIYKLKK